MKIRLIVILGLIVNLSACQSFQKNYDLEHYIVGSLLTYSAAKHICRKSEFNERCGVGSAVAFILWY